MKKYFTHFATPRLTQLRKFFLEVESRARRGSDTSKIIKFLTIIYQRKLSNNWQIDTLLLQQNEKDAI